jgi:hypothetical protein
VPNSIGPGGWGGDWYVWHAPDGLRARAATGLGCMRAGARKLGVIEASYASAIIGVLSPNTVRRRNWRSEKLPSLNTWIRYLSQCGGERGLFLLRRTVLFLAPCRLIVFFARPREADRILERHHLTGMSGGRPSAARPALFLPRGAASAGRPGLSGTRETLVDPNVPTTLASAGGRRSAGDHLSSLR